MGSTRGLGAQAEGGGVGGGGFSFSSMGSRIAKPLRGGGGGADGGGPIVPTFSNLQRQEAEETRAKRSSWFFNQR